MFSQDQTLSLPLVFSQDQTLSLPLIDHYLRSDPADAGLPDYGRLENR